MLKGMSNDYDIESYSNLPDYTPNRWACWMQQHFTWSHGVQAQGQYNWNGFHLAPVPKVFAYPDDGRYPGPIMKELLTKKLDLQGISPDDILKMKNTVNGFRSHNAADRVVHCWFFWAATDDMSRVDQQLAWTAHHGLKEVWADYLVLQEKCFDDHTLHFTADHKIDGGAMNNVFTKDNGVPHVDFKSSPRLMHLAQTVHVKNRRSTKTTSDFQMKPQTVEEITAKVDTGAPASEGGLIYNRLQNNVWGTWEALLIHLVEHGTFAVVVNESTRPVSTVQIQLNTSTPANNKQELERLWAYKDYTVTAFEDNVGPNGADKSGDDWKVWHVSEVWATYDQSVSDAVTWMYMPSELEPSNP